jgi:hypothetical protein
MRYLNTTTLPTLTLIPQYDIVAPSQPVLDTSVGIHNATSLIPITKYPGYIASTTSVTYGQAAKSSRTTPTLTPTAIDPIDANYITRTCRTEATSTVHYYMCSDEGWEGSCINIPGEVDQCSAYAECRGYSECTVI